MLQKLPRLLRLLMLSLLSVAARAEENSFPELIDKKNWDRGCDDWPLSLSKNGRESNPMLVVEKGAREFRFLAKLVLERQRGESIPQFKESIQKIVRDPSLYREWVLPGINQHPEGKSYFVEVENIRSRKLSNTSFDLTGPFTFKLLWFKRKGTTTIQFRVFDEEVPACDFFQQSAVKKRTVVRFRMIPRPDLLDWMIGEVWIVEGDNFIELRLRSVIKPYRPIFELMPLALVESELRYRAQRIFENLLVFRKNRALKK